MDKTGVLYEVECKKHEKKYIGETERTLKERAYDHRVIEHKAMNTYYSIKPPSTYVRRRHEDTGRPKRHQGKTVDYKTLHAGERKIINTGDTPVSEHMALFEEEHTEGDVTIKVIGREDDWRRRTIREAIRIREEGPNLNQDEGFYHISPIYSLANKSTSATHPRKNPEKFPRTEHPDTEREAQESRSETSRTN